jgi:glycosyltransferase involved in cell wall biosynthesis
MTTILSVATAKVFRDQLADINHIRFPRVDYIELQSLLDAETLDYSSYDKNYVSNKFRFLETQLRSDIFLATISWWKGRQYPLVFTWSERAGIPLAAFQRFVGSKNRFVTMFQSWSKRQEMVTTKLGLFSAMDDIIVHCASMKQNLVKLGVPEDKINIIHYSVDQSFFAPLPGIEPQRNMIMSIGEPRSRDYNSLFLAIDGLDLNMTVAASGHRYAREKKNNVGNSIPQTVSIFKHIPLFDLRYLYAVSQFVVLPIHDVVYSAGATATLEAGCMGRAVIAFRSHGIVDYVIDGETGILIDPGDISALREAIQYLLAHPEEAKRLGQNARQRIVEQLNLETYVCNIANLLKKNLMASV